MKKIPRFQKEVLCFVVLLVAPACIIGPVAGETITHPTDWYVSMVTGYGNYTNISDIPEIGAGDTVHIWGVKDYVYEGGVVIDAPNVTVKQWEGSPAQPLITSASNTTPAFTVTADNVAFRGLNISGNTYSGDGAGIHAAGTELGHLQRLTIADCTFAGNRAGYGALYTLYVDDLLVENTAFTGNTAFIGGGACFWVCGSATVSDCTFTGNTAHWGGGAYFESCTPATVTNCRFDNPTNIYGEFSFTAVLNTTRTFGTNIAGGPYLGGNLWLQDPAQNISECGTDADLDGICDQNLTIINNNDGRVFGTDFLPLIYANDRGTVQVDATPADAFVFVDGTNTTRTANNAFYLPAGSHTVSVQKEGYLPDEKEVTVAAGGNITLTFALIEIKHPMNWYVSMVPGYGNYTNISAIPDLGAGDTIHIWGVEGHTYEGGVTISASDVTVERWEGSPAQPLITSASNTTPAFTVTADNTTFRGLNISGNQISGNGAGINVTGTELGHLQRLTIADCTFARNNATSTSIWYTAFGGALYARYVDDLLVEGTAFTGNTATDGGGGAYFEYCNDATITTTNLTGNTAYSDGGGACFYRCAGATVTTATLANNNATCRGGGALFVGCSDATFTTATLTNNTAFYGGGAAFYSCAGATVTTTNLTGNTADTFGGGAEFYECDNATVSGATFTNNNATCRGGGAFFYSCAGAALTNCRFDNPTNIYAENSTAVLNTTRTFGTNIAGGPYLGGNLWLQDPAQNISEWGTDADFDGICDQALTINNSDDSVFGTDSLPLLYGGTVSVNSTPVGASVYLDGLNISRTTNASLYLPAGDYNVTVTLDDYVTPANRTVPVVPGETVPVVFELEHECGALAVSSVPACARIVLDGTDTGTLTNSTLNDVPTGEHNVTVTLAGYVAPANRTVTITTGETTEVSFELERGFGALAVSSAPAGARIVLDGTDTGTLTNSTLNDVLTGDYNVTVTLAGYVTPANRTVTITTGETTEVSFVLDAVPTPTPRSSSSGSGGESSDVAASSASAIPAGGNVSLTFSGPAIYEIRATAAEDIQDLLVTIEESGLPSGVTAPAVLVYEYDEVTLYHTTDDAVESALVLFKVQTSWLEEKGLDPADVVLYRYHDGAWQALPTDVVGEDATFRYFSAQSPGFSLFAIGGEKTPVAVETAAAGAQAGTTEAVQSVTTVETTSTQEEDYPEEEGAAEPFPITLLVCGAAFLIVAAVVIRKRR